MLKALGDLVLRCLTRVFLVAWRTGKTPKAWRTGVTVPIFKRGDQIVCSNCREITLLSQPRKVYASCLCSVELFVGVCSFALAPSPTPSLLYGRYPSTFSQIEACFITCVVNILKTNSAVKLRYWMFAHDNRAYLFSK